MNGRLLLPAMGRAMKSRISLRWDKGIKAWDKQVLGMVPFTWHRRYQKMRFYILHRHMLIIGEHFFKLHS